MEPLQHLFKPSRLSLCGANLLLCLALPIFSLAAEGKKEKAQLVSIPLESLDVQDQGIDSIDSLPMPDVDVPPETVP